MSNENQPTETTEPDRHLSKEELKDLAKAIFRSEVFTNLHIEDPGPRALAQHFMPIALADRDQIQRILAVVDPDAHHLEHEGECDHDGLDEDRATGMIYEYVSKAMPMGVNGLPVFASLQLLSPPETKTVLDMVRRLYKAEDEALDGDGD